MAKEKMATSAGFVQAMLQVDMYKRSQGRIARQVTGGALFVLALIAAYRLTQVPGLSDLGFNGSQYAIGLLVAVVGGWLSYRAVNYAKFADFLIAVEAEMNKVSWPSQSELVKASIVVIFVIFFLAGVLYGFDLLWRMVFYVGNLLWKALMGLN